MSNVKRYKLSNSEGFEIVVEVDHDKLAEKNTLQEINGFWSGADERLAKYKGNALKAVFSLLFVAVWWEIAARVGWSTVEALIYRFAWTDSQGKPKNGVEGWPELDGSWGLKLIEIGEIECDDCMTIQEVTA